MYKNWKKYIVRVLTAIMHSNILRDRELKLEMFRFSMLNSEVFVYVDIYTLINIFIYS